MLSYMYLCQWSPASLIDPIRKEAFSGSSTNWCGPFFIGLISCCPVSMWALLLELHVQYLSIWKKRAQTSQINTIKLIKCEKQLKDHQTGDCKSWLIGKTKEKRKAANRCDGSYENKQPKHRARVTRLAESNCWRYFLCSLKWYLILKNVSTLEYISNNIVLLSFEGRFNALMS